MPPSQPDAASPFMTLVTPLHKAAWHADLAKTRELLAGGASLGAGEDACQQTPLVLAARNACQTDEELQRRAQVVQELANAGSDVNGRDKCGDSPLVLAVMDANGKEKLEIVKVLLQAGADVDAKCESFKMTPLHWAAIGGHAKIAALLIEKGAALHAKDGQKRTPAQVAQRESASAEGRPGHKEVIALLEAAGGA